MPIAFSVGAGGFPESSLRKALVKHFGVPAEKIATAERQFPIAARVDIQTALEMLLQHRSGTTLVGVLSPNGHAAPAFANIIAAAHFSIHAGPLQHDEIDIGESVPARCLKNGLWTSHEAGLPFAVLMVPGGRFGLNTDVQVEVAVVSGELGARFSQDFSAALKSTSVKAAPIAAASSRSKHTFTRRVAAVWLRFIAWLR